MPLRYAQETQFLLAVDIILRVVDECATALRRVPLEEWPIFGGWELLLPERTGVRQPVELVAPEPDEAEGSDSSLDGGDVHPVVARVAESRAGLPDGWRCETQVLSSGREVPHFYGPGGAHARSRVAAWREFDKVSPCEACPMEAGEERECEDCSEDEAPPAGEITSCGVPGCVAKGRPGKGHSGPHEFPAPERKRHRPIYKVF
jgi:hypothetical protein